MITSNASVALTKVTKVTMLLKTLLELEDAHAKDRRTPLVHWPFKLKRRRRK